MNDQSSSVANIRSEQDIRQQRKARLMMLAIVAVFVLPFFLLPLFISPEQVGKTNKGLLIQPHIPLSELMLVDEQGQVVTAQYLEGKWILLYVIPDRCDVRCVMARDHALYAMRQVRLSLDRDVDRVQPLLVLTAEPAADLSVLLHKEFADMKLLRGNAHTLQTILSAWVERKDPAGNIFLMSPDGYVFMAYPTFVEEEESVLRARDIRADLKKSLKGDRHF